MKDDVLIEIFGEIKSVEAIKDVLEAAEEEGLIEWGYNNTSYFEWLRDAVERQFPLQFTRSDTHNYFDELSGACRTHGISYKMLVGPSGGEGYNVMKAWTPGMSAENEIELAGNNEPAITLPHLKKAAERGIDAVQSLIRELELKSLVNTPQMLVVAPELLEEFKNQDDAPSP